MRREHLCAVALLVVGAGAAIGADEFQYKFNEATGKYYLAKRIRNDLPNTASVCPPGMPCLDFGTSCTACHAQAPAGGPSLAEENARHRQQYFLRAKLPLAEGQTVPVGTATVTRTQGRLVLRDSQGRKHRLPQSAAVVGDRTRRPLLITYSGMEAPEESR
jgi:hypothetical protein